MEAALRAAGFRSWEEIEFDDGLWEIDDARADDGGKYDLKLDPNSLQIIHKEVD
ncbi:MAG TPA: PepSY domain-containing protein [Candidatus Tectomicrobia bacterium]|nr:PepSY domain-containing protein [Candidatus Tectomicrobia bacterium]